MCFNTCDGSDGVLTISRTSPHSYCAFNTASSNSHAKAPMPPLSRRGCRRPTPAMYFRHHFLDSLVADLAGGQRRLRQTHYAHKQLCGNACDDLDDFSAISGTYAHGSSAMLPVPRPGRREKRRIISHNPYCCNTCDGSDGFSAIFGTCFNYPHHRFAHGSAERIRLLLTAPRGTAFAAMPFTRRCRRSHCGISGFSF